MKNLLLSAFMLLSLVTMGQENFKLNLSSQIPDAEQTTMVTSQLQDRLYDLIAHYHDVQQAHWNVKGPQFESLHGLLGEFYGSLATDIDRLAERKLALGKAADGRPSAVATSSKVGSSTTGFQMDYNVVKDLVKSTKTLSDNLGDSIKATGNADIVSQDLLIGIKANIDH